MYIVKDKLGWSRSTLKKERIAGIEYLESTFKMTEQMSVSTFETRSY